MEKNKKRKFSDIVNMFNGSREIVKLSVKPIEYLHCEVCNKRIYDYKSLNKNYICCCYDCFSVLYLHNQKTFLDEKEKNKTFEDDEDMINN